MGLSLEVAVVADDLSGAADCAVAFRGAGLETGVLLEGPPLPGHPWQALVVPTGSRDADAAEAPAAIASAFGRLRAYRPKLRYEKVDSTLRGHLGPEVAAALGASGAELALVATAFPATGRTVVRGRGLLDGRPLEETELWRRSGRTGPADLVALLGPGGLVATSVGLEELRAGGLPARVEAATTGGALACDAEGEEDLAIVARAGLASSRTLLYVGSAGLARALAAEAPFGPAPVLSPDGPSRPGPVVVVVGSAAEEAGGQLERLSRAADLEILRLGVEELLAPSAGAARVEEAVARSLASGRDLAVGLEPHRGGELDPELSGRVAAALGASLGPHLGSFGGLVLTGGQTAGAVLAAGGVRALRLLRELEPGVPLSAAWPGGQKVVTKAGAFGDGGTLARCRSALRQLATEEEER